MMQNLFVKDTKRLLKSALSRYFAVFGLEVKIAGRHDWTNAANFIPFTATLRAADAAGVSVGDYIDEVMNGIPGATQATIDGMVSLGVFSGKIATVLEIGPGSGRYLEKTLENCAPERYEIYETSEPWAQYVAEKYSVIRQFTDGGSLRATASGSIDLVQAHKVFSSVNLMVTLKYWAEMARVTKPRGYIVFDVVTEACLEPAVIERWVASGFHTGAYPAAMPSATVTDYFNSQGFSCVGSFIEPMGPGSTEIFVLQKRAVAG